MMDYRESTYLIFSLNKQFCGIPFHKAKEIVVMSEIANLPKIRGDFKGVIHWRGTLIPLFDLRIKFGMKEQTYDARTCAVITEINEVGSRRLIGLVVDTVTEMINFQNNQIEKAPDGAQIQKDFLIGVGRIQEKVIFLTDIERVFNGPELKLIHEKSQEFENLRFDPIVTDCQETQ